jgi:hypothetical protein
MATRMNGSLRSCLAGSALGALLAFAYVPTAGAQWMPPWGARFPVRSNEVSRRKDLR